MQHTAQPMAFPPSESDGNDSTSPGASGRQGIRPLHKRRHLDTDSGHCMVLESIDPNSMSIYRRHTKLFAAPASSKGLSQVGLKVASYSTAATVLSWLLRVLAQDSEFGSQRLWGDGSPIQVGYEVTGRIADSSLTVAPRGFTAARLPSPSLWVWVSQMLGLTPVAPSRCIAAAEIVYSQARDTTLENHPNSMHKQTAAATETSPVQAPDPWLSPTDWNQPGAHHPSLHSNDLQTNLRPGRSNSFLSTPGRTKQAHKTQESREPLTLFSHIEINEYSIFKGTSNVIGSNTAEYHCNYESPEVMAQCQYLSSSIVQTDVDHPLERHPALELPDHFDN
ncbi:hypothetical protein CCUS01_14525 [Colletotrichum cuscutae]|uniref:Uncharacterized protein n=1 Tax=Colletotrichum cuscutae TaxID=1209917 RepID=A0AAI9Y8Y6_9PEZI|nr:hypothetical protein CCUS01_14525 [Colletotrichum cuscutae]